MWPTSSSFDPLPPFVCAGGKYQAFSCYDAPSFLGELVQVFLTFEKPIVVAGTNTMYMIGDPFFAGHINPQTKKKNPQ